MKSRNKVILTVIGIYVVSGSISCSTLIKIDRPTDKELPTALMKWTDTPSPTHKKTPTLVQGDLSIPTRLPYPTMTSLQRELFINWLLDPECILPCYLGIAPGLTSLEEAESRLSDMGVIDSHKWLIRELGDGYKTYGYSIQTTNLEEKFTTYVYITVKDGYVLRLETEIIKQAAPKLFDLWSRYSIEEVMNLLGIPDEIFVSTKYRKTYQLLLIYRAKGILAYFAGMMDEGSICPKFDATQTTGIHFIVTDLQSSLSLFVEGRSTPYDSDISRPIEEVFGIGVQAFYHQLLSDKEECFALKND